MITVITICNKEWSISHLPRWIRYVEKSGMGNVECIVKENDRAGFNRDRMGLSEKYGDVLYMDTDVDCFDRVDLCHTMGNGVGWIRSPYVHGEWRTYAGKVGYSDIEIEANNGFLYMGRSWLKEYMEAEKKVDAIGVHPRIRGTICFNTMIRDCGLMDCEISGDYSRMWWEYDKLQDAKTIHYCSQVGQEKRLKLEKIWMATQ